MPARASWRRSAAPSESSPHLAAAITGLAALLNASALAFQTLEYLGIAYLLFMAWKTIRDKGTLELEEELAPRSASHSYRSS